MIDLLDIMGPALTAVCLALLVEVPICLGLTFSGASQSWARCVSASDDVAQVTAMMWRSMDWVRRSDHC